MKIKHSADPILSFLYNMDLGSYNNQTLFQLSPSSGGESTRSASAATQSASAGTPSASVDNTSGVKQTSGNSFPCVGNENTCGGNQTSQCFDATMNAPTIVASGRQTLGLCPDVELSVLAAQLHDRAITDLDADESNQRQIQADKLAKSNSVIFVSTIKQGRRRGKYPKKSLRIGGGSLHQLRQEKARTAKAKDKLLTRTRRNQRDLKSKMWNNSSTDDSPKSVSKVELKETFDTTLSVINSPWNHAMPFLHRLHPFSRAIDDNKSSKGYMLLMRTYARNIGAEFNADYLSHTYWLQSNPEGMTHAAFFDYPYKAMYGWIYDASCDVNTDLLLKFQDRQCAICLEKIAMNGCIKGCTGDGGKRHLFHDHCLQTWIETGHRDCPTCRGELFFDIQKIGENTYTKIWTWFPSNYRLAEEPAEESRSEPVETIQQCLNRVANETDDRHINSLLILYSLEVQAAYEVYLEDRDWEEFKDTCRHCVSHWREREQQRRQMQQCLNRMANETDDEGFEHLLMSYTLDVRAAYEVYLEDRDWEKFKDSCRHCVFHWRDRENSPAAVEERRQIQLCLDRIADETNDQGLKNLLGMPDNTVVYAAYHHFLEDRDWEEFKDTCRHFLQNFRAYEDHEEIPEGSGEPAQSEPAQHAEHAEPAENVIIPLEERTNSMSRRHVEYLDHEAYVNGENDLDYDPWDDMTEEELLIGTRLSPPTTAEEHEETPEGSGEPAQSEPAIASRGCGIRLPRGSERQRVPYEGWSGGTCGVGDILCFNCAQNNAPEGSGEPAQSAPQQARELYGLPANLETPEQLFIEDTQEYLIRLAHEKDDEGFEDLYQYNSLAVIAAYEVYLKDRNWEEFKDTCTRILAHFRAEDIEQCCIRLANETNNQWFEQDLYQYNSLAVQAAHQVYLEDKNWEEFKDTCTRILAHFRAAYDDYETDPEDKAADLNDY